jgi:DNA-binding transcriptional ArsR family regulator
VPRDPLQPEKCALLLSALAAPERLRIIRLLTGGPRTVTEIIEGAEIKPLNVSHHLGVLRKFGLIRGKRRGKFVLYSLCPGVLEDAVGAPVPSDIINLGCCRVEFPMNG